jgi:NADH:ubiquinone oxidoreductase subunit F (NADH-binding)
MSRAIEPLLTSRYGIEKSWKLANAERAGAYEVARQALTTRKPAELREEVKKANIRGRGGAGFPAGVKWGFLNRQEGEQIYLVINADESEPGTFKDRSIMDLDPHRLVEGAIISCFAIDAHVAYIYVRGELAFSVERLEQAIAEARQAGYLGERPFGIDHPIDVYVHSGAGAYICGEETALLNSLEGRRGEPRLKPPFPAVKGAFGMPTIVNNVETIASVPDIVQMGGEAWSALGRLTGDGGVRIYGERSREEPGSVRSSRRDHHARADRRLRGRHAWRSPTQGGDSGWLVDAGARSAPQSRRAERRSPVAQMARPKRNRRAHGGGHLSCARHHARNVLRHRDGRHGQHG